MNTSSLLRQINASRCLRLLRGSGPLSRSDIARELDVTRTTAGNAVKLLLDDGLVWAPEEIIGSPRIGRPSVGLALNPCGAFYVGLHVETTAVTAVLIDLSMAVIATTTEPIWAHERGVEHLAARLASLAKDTILKAGKYRDRVRGVGVSIPGLVDRGGRIKIAPFLEWRDVDLMSGLREALGRDVNIRICNDAVAVARAICASSTEAETRDLLVILMSEGIGSALVQRGGVVEGANGFAGEIGQMIMGPTCRQQDTFQMLAGSRFFVQYLDPELPVIDALAELAGSVAQRSDLVEVMDIWAERLTIGFLNAIRLLDPERIVLGGPLSRLFPFVAAQVEGGLARELLGMQVPPISVSPFGLEGAAIGAAASIREDLFALPQIEED